MANRIFNDTQSIATDGTDIVTAGNGDTITFTRNAFYAAMGRQSHVLAIGRSITATINGELYSGTGPTVYGRLATSTANDFTIGASGIVNAAASAAFSIAGASLTVKNAGEIGGATGVLSTATIASINNIGLIAAGIGLSLAGLRNTIFNSGEIAGTQYAITIAGGGEGQQITNAGHINGGDGSAINIRSDGDILITNSGTIAGRTAINLDTVTADDPGARTIVNTGTIAALNFAVYGSAGADTLDNQGHISGKVNLFGGDDLYDGHAGTASALVTGDNGDDVIIGSLVARNLLGGGDGDDVLTGGSADDVLIGGFGADILNGGDGFDMVSYRDADAAVSASLYDGGNSDSDVYSSIEALQGSRFSDNLTGVVGSLLFGGDGNDVLNGRGEGRLVGGNGDDIYYPTFDRVVEAEGGGTDLVYTFTSYTLPANVENLTVQGGAADQFINSSGNALANTIIGDTARDVIDGREGQDILTGNSGADTFNFSTVLSPANVDTITDFNSVDDSIRFRRPIIGLPSSGLSGSIGSSAFYAGPSAHDGDDRVIYDQNTGNLYVDFDGIGGTAQVLVAHFNGNPSIVASDILLYG